MSPVVLYRASEFTSTGSASPEELVAIRRHFSATPTRMSIREGDLVIGRMSVLPQYQELEDDIYSVGASLINSWTQHRYIADLRNWYRELEGLTPKTWFAASDVPRDHPGPFILKGETNSKKHDWQTHMYAPTYRDIGTVLCNLQRDSMVGNQSIYVREFVELNTYFQGLNGMPVTEEYRFFICRGKVLSGGFYWSPHVEDLADMGIKPSAGDVPLEFLEEVISRVGDRATFWVLDVARTKAGDWIVVELNDGSMSGISENDPETLYSALAAVLGE